MKGELILIIEDETNIIELDRLYLEREGFTVESAMDGQAGLRRSNAFILPWWCWI
jgi:DNA-binding response OmpR family regulator